MKKRIAISIEPKILERVNKYAAKEYMSRSHFMIRAAIMYIERLKHGNTNKTKKH